MMAEDLMSKRKVKAPLWQYFGFKPCASGEPGNLNEAICKLCLMKVAASGGNTSNLHTHLQGHHKNEAAKTDPAARMRGRSKDVMLKVKVSALLILSIIDGYLLL